MKKMFSLFLALLFVLTSCAALAEEEAEIRFQGIPWGATAQETLQILLDDGWITAEDQARMLGNIVSGGASATVNRENGAGAISRAMYDDQSAVVLGFFCSTGKKVAGYEVEMVLLTFAYDGVNTSLVNVFEWLRYGDRDAAQADLAAKLSIVYGVPASNDSYNGASWIGANRTSVVLTSASLSYGTLDGEAIIKAYGEKAVQPNAQDVSGL